MESVSGCSLLLLCLQNVLPIPEVNEAHTDQFNSGRDLLTQAGSFLAGDGAVACHVPAETRDGQMTASVSLFQFKIGQVRLNCLWFKLIWSDSPLEQIIGPSWEAAATSTASHVTAQRLAVPSASTPVATAASESSGLGLWRGWEAGNVTEKPWLEEKVLQA